MLDFQDEINCSTGVKDLAAAVAWYETQLGCMAFFKDEAKGWASLSTPIAGFTLGWHRWKGRTRKAAGRPPSA